MHFKLRRHVATLALAVVAGALFAVARPASAEVVRCALFERITLAGVELARIIYLSDGLRISGFILRPLDRSTPLPVMIYNRGGNRRFEAVNDKTLKMLAGFAHRGYLVLASQYRGGQGSEGTDEFGGADVNDILSLMAITKTLKMADRKRIFMFGASRGGMMTYRMLSQTSDIRAAAVQAGVSDVRAMHSERSDMRPIIDELVGGDAKELSHRSAVDWAERLNTPLLLLHGTADKRVAFSHSRILAERMAALGKPHRLVKFAGDNHALNGNRSAAHEHIADWFASYDVAKTDEASGSNPPPKSGALICAEFDLASTAAVDANLVKAVIEGNSQEVGRLVAAGSDPETLVSFSHPKFARGREIERTPLVAAAIYGHIDVVNTLLKGGAAINAAGNAFATCPAVVFNHADIIKALIGAGLDVRAVKTCGRRGSMTPLKLAKRQGREEIVDLLVAAGAER